MNEYGALGRYEIIRQIGKGGMGIVLLGKDPRIDRLVALKVIHHKNFADPDHEAETVKRFHMEAKAAGKLSHHNIVTVYDVGDQDDVSYIAMELVEGRDLSSIIKERGRLSFQEATSVIVQVAMALSYSHDHGIIHRDIKPGNIMIDKAGVVKITDFGLARLQEAEAITKAGHTVGSPLYMSPEQLQSGDIDFRSDIFSMGVVYYELLTGIRPFEGDSMSEVIDRIMDEEPLSVTTQVEGLPPRVNTILARMLAKSPRNRYQTAGAAARDVKNLLALPDPFKSMTESDARLTTHFPGEMTPLQPFKKKVRPKPPTLRNLALAVILGALVALFGILVLGGESDRTLRTKDALNKMGDEIREVFSPARPVQEQASQPDETHMATQRPETEQPQPGQPEPAQPEPAQPEPAQPQPAVPVTSDPAPEPKPLPGPLAPPEVKPGKIILRSDVEGTVFIDGVEAGKTPVIDYPVQKGDHTMEIRAEGYQLWKRSVKVIGGETLDFEASLTLAEGVLLVLSDPPGATVIFQDQPKGATPVIITGLPLGIYQVRLEKNGYFPVTEQVRLHKHSGEKVTGVLSRGARLTVTSDEGAMVTIDGKKAGTGTVEVLLPGGPHEVEVSMEGRKTVRKKVETVIGKQTRVDVRPEKIKFGSIRISAAPWARIYLNGKRYGTTPRTLTGIPTGYVEVKLVNPGYQPYVAKILIEPGERARLAHTFTEEEAIGGATGREPAPRTPKHD
ncbi:MAG: PEGA domain-containing protein [Nitrospinota bacterium]|nr:PEGA domain-containing protein [Nitrospinota bacterium]